jgi:membrane protease YdiL (CAAX protease family)
LTVVVSSPLWWLIVRGSTLWLFALLMWSPAAAAAITQLAFRDRLRELGLSFGSARLLLVGYALPFLYAAPVYIVVWAITQPGFGEAPLVKLAVARFPELSTSNAVAAFVLLMVTVGFLAKAARALGEEIGWRGFLVPELAKVTTFTGIGGISGLMWALWHYPLIVFGGYHSNAPVWYALLCFTVMIVAWSYIAAWLRLRSGSTWPATVLHASHNALIQLVLNPLTVGSNATGYLIDEFGAGVALGTACVAAILWARRDSLPAIRRGA